MKLKNIIITICVVVIIILSFVIPNVVVKLQDDIMKKEVYKRGRIEGKIDIQAENIYLVQVIHKMEDSVQIGSANKLTTRWNSRISRCNYRRSTT